MRQPTEQSMHRAGRYISQPTRYKRNRVFQYQPCIELFSENPDGLFEPIS